MKQLAALVSVLGMILASPGMASETWCAVVDIEVPDGYLNLRGEPSTLAPILARLVPGQAIELSTGNCNYGLTADRVISGTVCADDGSGWVPVEFVPALDHGGDYRPEDHHGWVNEKYIAQVPCAE